MWVLENTFQYAIIIVSYFFIQFIKRNVHLCTSLLGRKELLCCYCRYDDVSNLGQQGFLHHVFCVTFLWHMFTFIYLLQLEEFWKESYQSVIFMMIDQKVGLIVCFWKQKWLSFLFLIRYNRSHFLTMNHFWTNYCFFLIIVITECSFHNKK